MAKITAPLLGISARGTIADTVTYSGWKGIDYARQRVIPANPRTTEQSATRNVFKMLGTLWVQMQSLARAPWIAAAVGKPFTHRNALISHNLPALRGETDMNNYTGSPGALAGIAPASIAAAYSSPNISVTLGAPTLPPDWTIEAAVATAFPDQDPADTFNGPIVEAEQTTAPYVVVLNVTSGPTGVYQCSAWFRYLRPDGRTAYGPALTTQATKT
jgi:hypothetical protein